MAETSDLGLFIPPEKAAELREQEQREQGQRRKISRRLWFRWLGWGAILAVLAQWTASFVFFFVPKKTGAFGGLVNAGAVTEIKVGEVKLVREGKFYLTRVPEGLFALWWKCPHLGCTIPWKENDPVEGGPPGAGDTPFAEKGRFNCPCHGSIYNRYGQIIRGPAPRPMDRFPVRVESGKILVDTGPDKAVSRPTASGDEATPA